MGGGNLGPVPARLIFLRDLRDVAVGDKVRFLGCVQHYDIASGNLTLRHDISPSSSPAAVAALVDVDLLLETLKSTDTSVGEWVNVIGYVTDPEARSGDCELKTASKNGNGPSTDSPMMVHVQAVMLWSAGAIRLGEYEKTLSERREVERRLALE